MNEQISVMQTREVLELMRNLAPILNQKELFEFMLFSDRVLKRYTPEHYNDGLSEEVTEVKKDKKWLKEEIKKLITEESQYMPHDEMVDLELVLLTIDKLEEPTKPVIPKFVADWIESYRKKTLVELINDAVYSSDEDSKCFRRWFHEEMGFESNYSEFLARAWLDGYEVEKEKRYRVVLPFTVWDEDASELNETTMFLALDITSGETRFSRPFPSAGKNGDYRTYLTESQIKAIDKRYWAFAQEVTE